MNSIEYYMRVALEEANMAASEGEVPVGAVIVKDDEIISQAHNMCEKTHDPTAHAEMIAIKKASSILKTKSLNDCEMYVTLEPCPMCAGAILMSNIGKLYYGAADLKQGCVESVYCICNDPSFYNNIPSLGGILESESKKILIDFFKGLRK